MARQKIHDSIPCFLWRAIDQLAQGRSRHGTCGLLTVFAVPCIERRRRFGQELCDLGFWLAAKGVFYIVDRDP